MISYITAAMHMPIDKQEYRFVCTIRFPMIRDIIFEKKTSIAI